LSLRLIPGGARFGPQPRLPSRLLSHSASQHFLPSPRGCNPVPSGRGSRRDCHARVGRPFFIALKRDAPFASAPLHAHPISRALNHFAFRPTTHAHSPRYNISVKFFLARKRCWLVRTAFRSVVPSIDVPVLPEAVNASRRHPRDGADGRPRNRFRNIRVGAKSIPTLVKRAANALRAIQDCKARSSSLRAMQEIVERVANSLRAMQSGPGLQRAADR
jgi:hypothetical protein